MTDAPPAAVARNGLKVLQVSFHMDELRREPDALLAAWPTLEIVARAARAAGVEVTVLQAAWQDAEIERDGVRYVFVRERPPSRARQRAGHWAAPARPNLIRRAGMLGADVVHIHGLAFPLHARRLGRRLAVPVLVQDRGNGIPPRWYRPLVRLGLAGVAGAAFTAREQAIPWTRAGLLPLRLAIHEVIGSSTRFSPGHQAAARAATGVHGDPCVLWIGRLNSNKDPFTALEAVRRAAQRLPRLRLWCCYTEAPLLESVWRAIAADPLLAHRVRLLGTVPPEVIEQLCRAADLFVATSKREATGFALIEALACGLTPVVTDIPAFRRITGGEVGALVPVGDADALARALIEQAGHDRAQASRAARTRFDRALSVEALGRQLRNAYEALRSPAP